MPDAQDLTIWKNRWLALDQALGVLFERIQKTPTLSRKLTLENLVKRLRLFAEGQFNFFYDGFGSKNKHDLASSDEFPVEYVFGVTLDQIGYDLEVLQRIVDQRSSGDQTVLNAADRLAWQALQPALPFLEMSQEAEDSERVTVVTYFQKSASIRVIPYAPVALIAIPFTCTWVYRDYLAIPHEVGHYVYRHGFYKELEDQDPPQLPRSEDQDPSDLFRIKVKTEQETPDYVKRWKEEIFADVYGCLIGGPVIALDFMDLMLQHSEEEFTQEGKEAQHPIPILRPHIYTHILEKDQVTGKNKLDQYWQDQVNKRYLPARNVPGTYRVGRDNLLLKHDDIKEELNGKVDRENQLLEHDDIKEELNGIAYQIFRLLSARRSNSVWSRGLAANEDVADLYKKFEDFVKQKAMGPNPDLPLLPQLPPPKEISWWNEESLWRKWVTKKRFFGGYAPIPVGQGQIRAGTKAVLDKFPNGDWIHVLAADGWATKGPHSRR
ncbi:MAG: hypothetical protein HS126_30550 [Anaerolineales bacterium]|nr:hypothetical protein [Anaerolineales bacterium]